MHHVLYTDHNAFDRDFDPMKLLNVELKEEA
jgi:hypothetical protein